MICYPRMASLKYDRAFPPSYPRQYAMASLKPWIVIRPVASSKRVILGYQLCYGFVEACGNFLRPTKIIRGYPRRHVVASLKHLVLGFDR